MREVLISIQPRWVEKIVRGEKTVEVRKTRPNCELPFKCYIYCTKGKPTFSQSAFCDEVSNGKVIGEFVCDKIVKFPHDPYDPAFSETADLSCVGIDGLSEYLGHNDYGYGWHITDLVVYDEPRALGEFEKPCEEFEISTVYSPTIMKVRGRPKFIDRPPQSFCYIEPRQTAD